MESGQGPVSSFFEALYAGKLNANLSHMHYPSSKRARTHFLGKSGKNELKRGKNLEKTGKKKLKNGKN